MTKTITGPAMDQYFTDILLRALRSPFRIKSDYARKHLAGILTMGQLGYLTTYDQHDQSFGKVWYITSRGLSQLARRDEIDPFDV